MTDCDEDSDFMHSDHEFGSKKGNIEYNRNVTDRIEIGSDDHQDKD